MKMYKTIILSFFLLAGTATNIFAQTIAQTTAEIDGIMLMREEEKLARDVYLTLYDVWNQPIFKNIAKAEQTHMDAVAGLIKDFKLSDPVADNKRGEFTNQELQQHYDTMVAQGSMSLLEALKIGATIEDLDIHDLNNLLAETTDANITRVYNNLKRGSENHLKSFMRQIVAQGGDYTPQFISEQEFNQIVK
jgi:hypothetical protein